jgi:thiol-disulfide isomerase/thioredoxin
VCPQLKSLEQLETLLVQSSALIVLDCHTPNCGPCKLMHPVFAANAQHFHNAIFLSVNTEQDDETRVRSPSLCLLSDACRFSFRFCFFLRHHFTCHTRVDELVLVLLVYEFPSLG